MSVLLQGYHWGYWADWWHSFLSEVSRKRRTNQGGEGSHRPHPILPLPTKNRCRYSLPIELQTKLGFPCIDLMAIVILGRICSGMRHLIVTDLMMLPSVRGEHLCANDVLTRSNPKMPPCGIVLRKAPRNLWCTRISLVIELRSIQLIKNYMLQTKMICSWNAKMQCLSQRQSRKI